MLSKVEVRNLRGDLLTLQLDDITNGMIVKEIQGLDPVKATIVSSNYAQQDGSQYQAARRENRNITMKLGLDPYDGDTTVSQLRQTLYTFFMSKAQVMLRFFTSEDLTVDISGRVESMESDFFTQDPEADISIINFDPDFYDPTPVTVTGFHTNDTVPKTIDYVGSIESGMVIALNVINPISEVTIYQTLPTGEIRSMDITVALIPGDVLTISTVTGSKSVILTRGGVDSSVLYGLSPQSPWLQLEPGVNGIQVYATGTPASTATVTYSKKYGGL